MIRLPCLLGVQATTCRRHPNSIDGFICFVLVVVGILVLGLAFTNDIAQITVDAYATPTASPTGYEQAAEYQQRHYVGQRNDGDDSNSTTATSTSSSLDSSSTIVERKTQAIEGLSLFASPPPSDRIDEANSDEASPDGINLFVWPNNPPDVPLLGACEGDCDEDTDCMPGLFCFFKNTSVTSVPGCVGFDDSRTDYCIPIPTPSPTPQPMIPPTPSPSSLPKLFVYLFDNPTDSKLTICQGDCDGDEDCESGLICYERELYGRTDDTTIPGCQGVDRTRSDFCIPPSALEELGIALLPTPSPAGPGAPTPFPTPFPTPLPTSFPTTSAPVASTPSAAPSLSTSPSQTPSVAAMPSQIPSATPSSDPSTSMPSSEPSFKVTIAPSNPTTTPPLGPVGGTSTPSISETPSGGPSLPPSENPTSLSDVSDPPSGGPSLPPSENPTSSSDVSDPPSGGPSLTPTVAATGSPSLRPSSNPSGAPTTRNDAQSETTSVRVTIFLDPWPEETSWFISDIDTGAPIISVPAGTYSVGEDRADLDVLLPTGATYGFVIEDTRADGIAGIGTMYQISLLPDADDASAADVAEASVILLEGDGAFTSSRVESFYVPRLDEYPTAAPTSSSAPSIFKVPIYLTIAFDVWHQETSWSIVRTEDPADVLVIRQFDTYRSGDTITEEIFLEPSIDVTFTIFDFYEDGINGGAYVMKASDGTTLFEGGGNFGQSRSHQFIVPES